MMPVINGIELAELIRKEFPAIKVCFLTAHKDFEFAQKAISLNVIQYILKSASSTELLHIFHEIKDELDKSAARQSSLFHPASPADADSEKSLQTRDSRILNEICQYVYDNYATADPSVFRISSNWDKSAKASN